ncbi:hypothetical protein ACLOAV_006229 [Pseudogymnoascus australis]
MGRVTRSRTVVSLNARRRSTRFHRDTRFRAFRSVLKCIERLPAGFMKKLKWSTPRIGHRSEASQNNGQVLPQGYVANHADTPAYFAAGNVARQNLQDKQQAWKRTMFSARKTRIRRRNARKHSTSHPNYMGISPAILLEKMVKIERIKRKSSPVSGNARTSNAIMLQAAMSEDSPTMISVKNIEGIQHALSFLSNLPENVLPTFVQRNPALKTFIQRMESHNTSITSGRTGKPKNGLGIIEQTVNQLQRRGLVKPYLDKLATYFSGPEAFSMNAETLMQKVLVDATNSAALTPRPRNGNVFQDVDMMKVDTNEQNVQRLHIDTSKKRAVISLEGSRCCPIDLDNIGLPQGLFQELPNVFLDKPPNIMVNSRGHVLQRPPNSILGKRVRFAMPTDPRLLQFSLEEEQLSKRVRFVMTPDAAPLRLSPEDEAFTWKLHLAKAAPAVCNHAPCTFNTREDSEKEELASPFREAPIIGGLEGQYLTTPFDFENDVAGELFYEAAMNSITIRELGFYVKPERAQQAAEAQKYRGKIRRYCEALQQSRLDEGHLDSCDYLPYPAVSPEELSGLELELTESDKSVARREFMEALAKDTPELRRKHEEDDIEILFPELKSIWHKFEEEIYSEPRPVHHEPIKVSQEPSSEVCSSIMGQSGRESKRHQIFLEEEIRPQHPSVMDQPGCGSKRRKVSPEEDPWPQCPDPLLDDAPIFYPGSPQMSASSESDIFVDCEEEISLVRSSPPKEATKASSEAYSGEVMLRNQLGAGPVYSSQNTKLYSFVGAELHWQDRVQGASNPSLPEGAWRNPYSAETDKASEKSIRNVDIEPEFSNLTIAKMLPNIVSDTRVPSDASVQAAMATDSILVSESPFVPLSLASEPMADDCKSCPKCDKTYKYMGFLKKHIQVCQGPGIPEEYPFPLHPCPACGKLYKKQGYLSTHMESCNSTSNNSSTTGFPKQEMEEKARESLVPFPRDNARDSSGRPLCEACRSEFTSKKELAKHIRTECTTLRVRGSNRGSNKKQLGTPRALNFKEPMSGSDFERSGVDNMTEIPSSKFTKFTTPLGKYVRNPVREKRQSTKDENSGIDCGVRKGSMAEQLEIFYGPQSKYHAPTDLTFNVSPIIMENPTLEDYSGENGAKTGEYSDMDISPTPGPKSHSVGRLSKLASTASSRQHSPKIGMFPGAGLTVGGENLASVSRVLVLEPGLSELQDTKPQPIGRKLFSRASGAGVFSPPSSKVQDQQVPGGFELDFPPLPLPACSSPHKASTTRRKRPSQGSGPYRNKLESLELEVVTIQCSSHVVCDDIVNIFGAIKEEDVRRQIVSVSGEDGLTVKVIVRPGFDITRVRLDELPGAFVDSGDKTFIFLQTGPETPGVSVGKEAGEKQELELGTPDEKSVERTRGWNLRQENRKKRRGHH